MADSASFIAQFDVNLPTTSATLSLAADRWQHIKRTVLTTLPNMGSEMSATPGCLNHLNGLTSNLQTQLDTFRGNLSSMSANIQVMISDMQSAVESNMLSANGTAIDSLEWDGAKQYFQTATPSAQEGAIWFQL